MSPLLILGLIAAIIGIGYLLLSVRYVPNNAVGVLEKRWSLKGAVQSGVIALRGEAGYQPRVLRGGLYFYPFIQYVVHTVPLVTIPQGQIGYVFARDGKSLEPTQTLATIIPEGRNFQDVEGYLKNGGQRGPSREILREGTIPINLAQFVVLTAEHVYYLSLNNSERELFDAMSQAIADRDGFRPITIKGADDMLAVMTVHDGPALGGDDIIAPTVGNDPAVPETYHNNFQDPEKFLRGGGQRGRQLQVLVEGTYYVNRLFATAELVKKTIIEVGFVGVVIAYSGEKGSDVSGTEYKHGELVERGQKGVWSTALNPGKYAINTYAMKVVPVPTTNIILKWNKEEFGAHGYDKNLQAVLLITKDAFEPLLNLAVVIHIDYRKAPLVIQRFGNINMLVEQTLDPLISAYFKDTGQTRTLIQLIQERGQIQQQALVDMKVRFGRYNIELEEVLIGTPAASATDHHIETILEQLRTRQIAVEQIETYERKQTAAVKERELRQAEAVAQRQTALTESEIAIVIQSNEGKAEYQRSLQEAAKIKALADAEAEAQARIGIGKALAAQELVNAYGSPRLQVIQQTLGQFTQAIEKSGVPVVPHTLVTSGGEGGSHTAFEALLTTLLTGALEGGESAQSTVSDEAKAMGKRLREQLREQMASKPDEGQK